MDIEGSTTRAMRHLIATAGSDKAAEHTLRQIMSTWADRLPAIYLAQVGQILLQSHLDEQRDNVQAN